MIDYDPHEDGRKGYEVGIAEIRRRKIAAGEIVPWERREVIGRSVVYQGDSREVIRTLPDASVDATVCDPPYALVSIVKRFGASDAAPARPGKTGAYARASAGFMGKKWDTGETAFDPEFWREVLRVMKPGAHLLAFGGTRTYHRLACAIEDAGFEIRDTIMWLYGSGFCKSHNLRHQPICDCAESGNPVPYSHGKQASEHHLRSVRSPDLPAPVDAVDQCREVLFEGVSEQGAQERRAAWPEPEAGAGEQFGVEGRPVHRAGQGLRDDPDAGSSTGSAERLCVRAHPGGGENVGQAVGTGRGSAPREPGSSGQSAGEPEGVREPSGALDGGALSGRGECPRCGKLRKEFEGFGTALKPAVEPVILARKPLIGTVASNVLQHGTGALNIDGCRVRSEEDCGRQRGSFPHSDDAWGRGNLDRTEGSPLGRWPANVLHDGSDEVLAAFPAETGNGRRNNPSTTSEAGRVSLGQFEDGHVRGPRGHDDTGSAARFFYTAKATKADRLGSKHPTVKPVDLMRYLCRLVTPPGGTVLDPFAGSGTTGMACMAEGFNAILIEREAEYFADIERRLAHVTGADEGLFAEPKHKPEPPDMFGSDAA